MADDNSRLLSDEELLAIEEMVASGDLDGEGFTWVLPPTAMI